MKIRIIAIALLLGSVVSPAIADDATYSYGTTPQLTIPRTGYPGWGPRIEEAFKNITDFSGKFANPDGTLKTTTTATPWQSVTSTVTYVSATSFSVSSSFASYFETGRKVWLVQATQVIGSVLSVSTVGGTTTVTLSNIVLYSDNFTPAYVGNPVTSVSVSMATPRSAPSDTYRRNVIINGHMAVDQRHSGAAQTITAGAALAYTVDQWYAYSTGANVTGQRLAGSGQSQYRYQFTGAASVTAIGFGTRIEAKDTYHLNGSTATLSVDLSNSLLTSVTWTAYYANSADAFGTLASPTRTQIATGTFTVSSPLARYNAQIAIPAAATTGIEIVFSVGAQTSGTWIIGDVQLEPGFIPTAFEREPYSATLIKCQRYLPAFNGIYIAANSQAISTTQAVITMFFPVQTRIAPTGITISAAGHFNLSPAAGGANACSAVAFNTANPQAAMLIGTVAASLVAGNTANFWSSNSSALILFTGAEL